MSYFSNDNNFQEKLNDITEYVSKIIVLTQAEYDSLPSSKLTNSVLYLISDAV